MNKRQCRQLGGLTFNKALNVLNGREQRKLCANTWLVKLNHDWIGLLYHNTYIIRWSQNGEIEVNNGGWYTSTTKERMNIFLPSTLRVWSEKGEWMVRDATDYYPYANGMFFKQGQLVRE